MHIRVEEPQVVPFDVDKLLEGIIEEPKQESEIEEVKQIEPVPPSPVKEEKVTVPQDLPSSP